MRMGRIAAALAGCLLGASAAFAQDGPTVSFFGPLDGDGCAFCCEFRCRLTPTPTPHFDGEGKRVFSRRFGRFLLVLEGRSGVTGLQPGDEGTVSAGGSVVTTADPSGRPSVQVLANRSIGNGSLAIDCQTVPLGGVPGIAPPDFRPGSDVTQALADMACRFVRSGGSSSACTVDEAGDFSFLNSASTRQFCFQVPEAAVFPPGDTIVAVQLRDTRGVLGPRREIVVRVGETDVGETTATPTSTPTATPTEPSSNVAGRIQYYNAGRPVPGVTVRLHGSSQLTAVTNALGDYAFDGLVAQDVVVEPEKGGDFGAGVSSLDAAYVLQVVVGQRVFDSTQRLACDVTGNGSVSALDAAHILQYQIGLRGRFDVAVACDSDWVFVPSPEFTGNQRLVQPGMSSGSCQRGAVALEPLEGTVDGQDFLGVPFGDCTGNWQPSVGGDAVLSVAGRGQ